MTDLLHERYAFFMQKHSVFVQLMYVFLSVQRISHCRRVASLCVEYAPRFGVDSEDAFLVGIAHDVCREYSAAQLLKCAYEMGLFVEPYEIENPILLHGKVAPMVLDTYYPMSCEVYAAIESHTLGCEKPSALQKLIYVCDAFDEQRRIWAGDEGHRVRQRIVKESEINAMVCMLITYMEELFHTLHPITQAMKKSCTEARLL